jgi:hypothetical protein
MSNNNDKQRRPKIVEDVPTMMSVAMMPSMAPPIPLRVSAPFLKPALEPYHDSKVKVSRLPPVVEGAPWKVSKPLAIPSYYQLDRTHVYVPDASSLEVSERIADCLRKNSIAATFDDKQVCNAIRRGRNNRYRYRKSDVNGVLTKSLFHSVRRHLQRRRLIYASSLLCVSGKRMAKS